MLCNRKTFLFFHFSLFSWIRIISVPFIVHVSNINFRSFYSFLNGIIRSLNTFFVYFLSNSPNHHLEKKETKRETNEKKKKWMNERKKGRFSSRSDPMIHNKFALYTKSKAMTVLRVRCSIFSLIEIFDDSIRISCKIGNTRYPCRYVWAYCVCVCVFFYCLCVYLNSPFAICAWSNKKCKHFEFWNATFTQHTQHTAHNFRTLSVMWVLCVRRKKDGKPIFNI